MKSQSWSLTTRFLHLSMVLTVSFQLLISLFMVASDEKGGAIAKGLIRAHSKSVSNNKQVIKPPDNGNLVNLV